MRWKWSKRQVFPQTWKLESISVEQRQDSAALLLPELLKCSLRSKVSSLLTPTQFSRSPNIKCLPSTICITMKMRTLLPLHLSWASTALSSATMKRIKFNWLVESNWCFLNMLKPLEKQPLKMFSLFHTGIRRDRLKVLNSSWRKIVKLSTFLIKTSTTFIIKALNYFSLVIRNSSLMSTITKSTS